MGQWNAVVQQRVNAKPAARPEKGLRGIVIADQIVAILAAPEKSIVAYSNQVAFDFERFDRAAVRNENTLVHRKPPKKKNASLAAMIRKTETGVQDARLNDL